MFWSELFRAGRPRAELSSDGRTLTLNIPFDRLPATLTDKLAATNHGDWGGGSEYPVVDLSDEQIAGIVDVLNGD